jgi:MFS family permease
VFKRLYPKDYTPSVSTRVSNALLVGRYTYLNVAIPWALPPYPGAIIGQLFVGLVCDRMGRKVALVFTTLLIVLGATLGTAAHGAHGSAKGLFWFLTFARGITGIVRTADTVWSLVLIVLPGCGWRVSGIVYQCQRGSK